MVAVSAQSQQAGLQRIDFKPNVHIVHFHIELHGVRILLLVHDLVHNPEDSFNLLALQLSATFLAFFNFLVLFLSSEKGRQ